MVTVYQKALDRLTLADVWELGPHAKAAPDRGRGAGPPSRRGLYWSPLRVPGDNPTFSVQDDLQSWHDFARDVGGKIKRFVQEARPEWSEQEIAEECIRRAGLEAEAAEERRRWIEDQQRACGESPDMARPVKPVKPVKPKPKPKEWAAINAANVRRERERMALPSRPWWMPMAPCVRERWEAAGRGPDAEVDLAEYRGWPVEWAAEVLLSGLAGRVVAPWHEVDEPRAMRHWGWRVDGHAGGSLAPVGVHARWVKLDDKRQKPWCFFPSWGDPEKRLNRFRREVNAWADRCREDGSTPWNGRSALCPPLPLVLGYGAQRELDLAIVVEGEWDAVSVFGALGGFEDVDVLGFPWVVFGLRGTSGVDAWLGEWGSWLRARRPVVWLIRDADEAGARMVRGAERRGGAQGLRPLSLPERLRGTGVAREVVCRSPKVPGCKDFNDYWRARRPSIEAMRRLVGKVMGE